MTNWFRSLRETAERVNEAGVPIKLRGVQGWVERHPDISWKIAGRRRIPDAAIDLIVAQPRPRRCAGQRLCSACTNIGARTGRAA